jgi:Ni/Co efflux regulator RcnB
MRNKSIRASRPSVQRGDYADEQYRKEALRILATFGKAKPDKGKKWISQEEHDLVLYRVSSQSEVVKSLCAELV